MTTAIIVDAHAGWDVEVQIQTLSEDGSVTSERVQVVKAFTKETFYIHSHMQIGQVKELPNGNHPA
jgi:hypothetical protein